MSQIASNIDQLADLFNTVCLVKNVETVVEKDIKECETNNTIIKANLTETHNKGTGAGGSNMSVNELVVSKQRTVNKELGKNITKDHTRIYNEIEKRIGKTKICNFGNCRGSKTGVKHEGCNDVPIRDFELKGTSINDQNSIIIKNGDGLQGFCKVCSKRRRTARLNKENEEKKNKTPEEIYALYIKKYSINTKRCSRCEKDKSLCDFNLSIGMECGLHNMCKLCSSEYGSSVGDRWIIYMPDGNYKYNKKDKKEHDDHIFPLSLGGSNEKINHQLLSSIENLKKSNDITQFVSIQIINPELLSSRYRVSLTEAENLNDLKIILNQYIHKDLVERSRLSDETLLETYKVYCEKYNLRRDITRAVKKFREYCKLHNIV